MRVTKSQLLDRLRMLQAFHDAPVKYVLDREARLIREKAGLILPHCYAHGPILKGEIGMLRGVRYREWSRKTDR